LPFAQGQDKREIFAIKSKRPAAPAVALLAMLVTARGQIYLNLNSVDASAGPVDATALLASYGITLSGVSPSGGDPLILNVNQSSYYSDGITPDSPPNFLLQQTSYDGESYTLNFSTPLSELQFSLCAIVDDAATPIWSATAYEGDTELGSVGATYIDEDTGTSAQTFTFTGSGIISLTVYGNAEDFAAYYSAPLDDFYLTPVPEPTTLALAGLSGLSLLFSVKRRRA